MFRQNASNVHEDNSILLSTVLLTAHIAWEILWFSSWRTHHKMIKTTIQYSFTPNHGENRSNQHNAASSRTTFTKQKEKERIFADVGSLKKNGEWPIDHNDQKRPWNQTEPYSEPNGANEGVCVCVYVTSSSHGRDGTTRSKTPQKSRASRVKTDEKEKQQVGCQGGREEILRQVMEARFARSEKVLGATSREVGLDEAKDVLEKKTRITTTNNETVDVSVSKSLSIGVEDVRIAPAGMNDEYRDLS